MLPQGHNHQESNGSITVLSFRSIPSVLLFIDENLKVNTGQSPDRKHFIRPVTFQDPQSIFHVTHVLKTGIRPKHRFCVFFSNFISKFPPPALFCDSTISLSDRHYPLPSLGPTLCWQLLPGRLSAVVSYGSPSQCLKLNS